MSGGTRSYEFALRLVAAGHEVHVITANSDRCRSIQSSHELIDGLHVHWLPVTYSNQMSYMMRILAFFRFAIISARKATKIGGDIVFATSTPLTIALPGVFTSRVLRIPMVFEVRDLWPEMPIAMGALHSPISKALARALERFAYRHSSHVIALSPGMAEGVQESGYPRDRITIIPNGCDISLLEFDPAARNEFLERHAYLRNAPLVVYAGTLGRIHGVEYLVDIAYASHNLGQRIKFLIVGDGSERQSIEAKARNLGVFEKNLWMISPVSKTEMAAILSTASLATSLVIDLPELWKNSANKFFDALASGTPIAINHQGWQADLLGQSGAGIVLPPQNAAEAARLLQGFVSDESRLNKAARAAKQLAIQQFDREKLASQMVSVLQDAASSKPVRLTLHPAR